MTIQTDLLAAVAQAGAAAQILHDVANGPASGAGSTVATDAGAVKTVAKAVGDLEESASAAAAAAAASAATATTQAAAAAASAATATTQATNAATSAASASTSAATATTQADDAGTSATSAATSATSAASSAATATASATTATTKAAEAAASAASLPNSSVGTGKVPLWNGSAWVGTDVGIGDLVAANNLADLDDAAAARGNLGAAAASHGHASTDISDFTEATQDVVGAMVAAAGGSYNDGAGTIAFPAGGSPGWVKSAAGTFTSVSQLEFLNISKTMRFTFFITGLSGEGSLAVDYSINNGAGYGNSIDRHYNYSSQGGTSMSFRSNQGGAQSLGTSSPSGYPGTIVEFTINSPQSSNPWKIGMFRSASSENNENRICNGVLALRTASAINAMKFTMGGPTFSGQYIAEEIAI